MILAKRLSWTGVEWRMLCSLVSVLWIGCVQSTTQHFNSRFSPFHRFNGPEGTDIVFVESALLQANHGEHAIEEEIWSTADDLVVSPETRAALKANGLRVAQVGGIMPTALMKLLTDPHTCVKAHRHIRRSGGPIELPVGGVRPSVEFVYSDGTTELPQHYSLAQFKLHIVPQCDPSDGVTLEIAPRLYHGEQRLRPEAGPSGGGWSLVGQQDQFTDPRLKCQLTLSPNEYILIGGYAQEPLTFGGQCFFGQDGTRCVQWVIALRAGRMQPNNRLADGQVSGIVPLALQASQPALRH